jgi:cystathionine beta-lyase
MKWERWAGRDVLPLWVADMDVAAPPAVLAALRARLDHPVLGYTLTPPSFTAAACGFLARRFGWTVPPEAIVPLPGVVTGFNQFVRAIGAPGDGHLCPLPVYPPLIAAPGRHGQRLQAVGLRETASGFALDPEALAAATDAGSRGLLLCSPHNPTGRVWRDDELALLAGHCRRHDLWVCSDEI